MGRSRQRHAKFLEEHPTCCFCGGDRPATTEDHVPNRALFDERRWPEGYCFPACEPCNNLTRADEKILAFLSRINHGDRELTDIERSEMRKAMRGVSTEFPDAFASMKLSGNEVRGWLRERGVTRPPGQFLSDVPLISMATPQFRDAIKTFSTKLLCALHYKHCGVIVPSSAAVCGRWISNIQMFDNDLPAEILQVMGSTARLRRANNDLQDQFGYRYTVATEKTVSAFLCSFRMSFVLVGVVAFNDDLPDAFNEDLERGMFKGTPFRH